MSRSRGQEARGKGQGEGGKWQESRGRGQEAGLNKKHIWIVEVFKFNIFLYVLVFSIIIPGRRQGAGIHLISRVGGKFSVMRSSQAR